MWWNPESNDELRASRGFWRALCIFLTAAGAAIIAALAAPPACQ